MSFLSKWLKRAATPARSDPEAAASAIRQGNALLAQGQTAAAARFYEAALVADAANADACVNLGFVLKELGQPAAASEYLVRATQLNPGSADAHYLLGMVAEMQGNLSAAMRHLEDAVAIDSGLEPARLDLCRLYLQERDPDTVLRNLDRAIALQPDFAEAHLNRAYVLQSLGRLEEALASCDLAIGIRPAYPEAFLNRGNALKMLCRLDAAIESYDQALRLRPDYVEAWNNRGSALHDLGRFAEALASFENALRLKPDYADAHWNQSLTRFLLGDYGRAWAQYEWRWQRTELKENAPTFKQPLWLGTEDLQGKTILLHAEQGLGDTLQFCRYAERVAALGARVLMGVPAVLIPVLKGLRGVSLLASNADELPPFDYHCPLLSLPLAFKTELQDISGKPYLQADSGKLETWRKVVGERRAPRVGLVWSGSTSHRNDRNRSIPFTELQKMLLPDIEYFCLQKEIRPADREALAAHPEIRSFEAELRDFGDTAALSEQMDLVISVDTSVAHLAGALGKEVWILLPRVPDWRWLLERSDSPWYDSARLFRQPQAGDWDSVLRDVSDSLRKRCHGR